MRYQIPAGEARVQFEVNKSVFIATIAPVFTVDEARAFVLRIKAEFADASHNVPVYLVGGGSAVTAHCNDDGEPSGTAGKPALAVLKGSGLGDVAVVITRYFGGTKLGTGGLVRAYSDGVRLALRSVQRAEKVPTHTVMLALPYTHFERVKLLVTEFKGQMIDEDFAADITLTIQFEVERFEPFQVALNNMSQGGLAAEIIETNRDTIMPIEGQEFNN